MENSGSPEHVYIWCDANSTWHNQIPRYLGPVLRCSSGALWHVHMDITVGGMGKNASNFTNNFIVFLVHQLLSQCRLFHFIGVNNVDRIPMDFHPHVHALTNMTQSYYTCAVLTHWGRVMHICVGNLTTIRSDNGLSPGRRQAIIRTKCWNIVNSNLRNKFQWNLKRNSLFSFKKMHLKMSSGKWQPFCLSLNVLNQGGIKPGWTYHKFNRVR